MRTNLQNKFRAVRDVRTVLDPWGMGWAVQIRRDGCEFLRKLRDDLILSNPMMVSAMQAGARAVFMAKATGNAAKASEALERAASEFNLPASSILSAGDDDEKLDAARFAGWSGLTNEHGAVVPFSAETALELLRSEEWIDEGLPLGGQTLGKALRAWVGEESRKAEAYRDEVVAEAAGN